jgi:hypothetical protein
LKDIIDLSSDLKKMSEGVIENLVHAQRETAKQIEIDVKNSAPVGNGTYRDSIKTSDTVVKKGEITTKIITNLIVGPAKSTGQSYILGKLLENGTSHHAIPNAFGWGDIFGYDSPMYQMTLNPYWHPGFVAMPHFQPSLDKNKQLYRDNIGKALDEVFK